MIVDFIGALVLVLVVFHIWSKMYNEKINFKCIRTWFLIFVNTIAILINYFNTNKLFKFITITLFFIVIYKFLFSKKLRDSVLAPIMSQTIYIIAESLFACIMFMILENGVEEFVNDYFGTFITNVSVSTIALLLSKIKIFSKVYNTANGRLRKIDDLTMVFLSMSIIYIYSIFAFNIYYGSNPEFLMIMSVAISIMTFVLVYLFIKLKYDYHNVRDKYSGSLDNLKELERVLTNQRIDNHENKNHLMTIRNMTTNKKVTSFIDSILDNKLKDNKDILHETSILPEGGLRGLLYAKLLDMVDKNIDYELDVASSIRLLDSETYGEDTMLDICKIVGIFLDNAIEEVETIEEKYIVIEMYIENEILTISITNGLITQTTPL